jgi:hypothetical protein
MQTLYASPELNADIGEVVDLPKDEAEALIESDQAVPVGQDDDSEEETQEEPEAPDADETELSELEGEELEEAILEGLVHADGGWYVHDLLDESVQGEDNAIEAVKEAIGNAEEE